MLDLNKLFEESLQKETELVEKRADTAAMFGDQRIVRFKKGNATYKFRLLFAIQDGSKRRVPFFLRYVHKHFDEAARKRFSVVCPTSEYLLDKAGFSRCPICKKTSAYYKDFEKTGSKTSKELYESFKRQMEGYALVYVIKDPTTPTNEGTVKILKFGWSVASDLKKYIYGIVMDKKKGDKKDEDVDVIGVDAFKLEKGFDLIISTTQQNDEYNKYSTSFARQATKIPLTQDEVQKAVNELNFDKDFYTESSAEELNEFVESCISMECGEPDLPTTPEDKMAADIQKRLMEEAAPEESPIVDDTNEDMMPAKEEPKKESKKESKKEAKTPSKQAEEPTAADTTIDDFDVDSLFK
ncbi:MAG TPA: hypothetical protein PLA71_01075 [Saccharofermentans sp.]|nr:hypothetical protein [Saccharofermentans sp.]